VSADLRDVLTRNLRAERTRAELTQPELADRLGWTRDMVSKMERGQRTIGAHELPALCEALGCTVRDLLRGADPQDLAAFGYPQP
jgi:transcriptional regulator with XRE-family HTH domain